MFVKKIIYFILIAGFFTACTRDDICTSETSKTPLMIVEFFDFVNPEEHKAVTNFTLAVVGDSLLMLEPITTDSIAMALPTSQDSLSYFFISQYTDSTSMYDKIRFSYHREDEYISRACGFKTHFYNLQAELGSPTPYSWVIQAEVVQDTIDTEHAYETHLRIYH